MNKINNKMIDVTQENQYLQIFNLNHPNKIKEKHFKSEKKTL